MNKDRLSEILRFLCAGAVSFAVELIAFIVLKQKLQFDTLAATPIAFILAVIVNYLMCVMWVFHGAGKQSRKSRIAFLITSAVGLLLNEILMLLFRVIWGENTILFTVFTFAVSLYMLNKVLATCIVMIWNYFTKRLILTRNQGEA